MCTSIRVLDRVAGLQRLKTGSIACGLWQKGKYKCGLWLNQENGLLHSINLICAGLAIVVYVTCALRGGCSG